jgi:hypothetical protein
MALKIFIIICILAGIYFYTRSYTLETMSIMGGTSGRCPNMLIQKGAAFYLYNTKLAEVPGVNPVRFNNLEEYVEFLDWQRSQGIRCPVLYLQETYDAQGNPVYKARPSVSEPQAGLPPSIASSTGDIISESSLGDPNALAYPNPVPTLLVDATRNDPPYNKGSYPAYDETSYYIGTTTPLDKMNIAQEQAVVSPDPMDPNWGGQAYTQSLIDKGYYKGNEVSIAIE